jgi:hypothetical protein
MTQNKNKNIYGKVCNWWGFKISKQLRNKVYVLNN